MFFFNIQWVHQNCLNSCKLSMQSAIITSVYNCGNIWMILMSVACWIGPGSVISVATGYRLDGLGIESWWGRDFPQLSRRPGAHPASWTMGTWSFPGIKNGWGMTLTPHPLLVPWSRKSRPVPLLPLWAIRPVQSLSACTRVHFTFFTLEFYICHEGVCQCGHLSGHILKLCTAWGPTVCFKLQPVYIQCKSALLSVEQEAGWAAEPVQLL